jgi:hypothetical protein
LSSRALPREAWIAVGTAIVAVLLAFVAFFAFRHASPQARASSSSKAFAPAPSAVPAAAAPPAAPAHPPPTPVPPAPTPRDAPLLQEAALMDSLRELGGSDPGRSLRLAREGNRRFKASADAAERAWFAVKALSDLGHHDEARLEGRALVAKYAGTRWADDAYRHLFVNPPTHPLERGYGKTLESDP